MKWRGGIKGGEVKNPGIIFNLICILTGGSTDEGK